MGVTGVSTATGESGPGSFGGVKPRQILEILAISADAPVSKERLAELLWDGEPPKSYLATLESYICVLRRSIREAGGDPTGILTVPQGYVLVSERLKVDLVDHRVMVRAAHEERGRDAELALSLIADALELVRGELLASESYAAWALAERSRFARELGATVVFAAETAAELGRWQDALRWATLALSQDRLAEDAWRVLMRAHWAMGCRAEAIRSYFELRSLLDDELGTAPSPESSALYLEMIQSEDSACEPVDVREELRVLLQMMRRAVTAVPGMAIPQGDREVVRVAVELLEAS